MAYGTFIKLDQIPGLITNLNTFQRLKSYRMCSTVVILINKLFMKNFHILGY